MNNSTLIYPNTHYNEGIRTTTAKDYLLIMNLYPPHYTNKFQFDVKYRAY